MRSLYKIFLNQSVPMSFHGKVETGRIANRTRIRIHDFYRRSPSLGLCVDEIITLIMRN